MKNLSEDHKEIQSGKKLDDEGYMVKVEMDKIEQSLEKLRKIIKKPDMQLPAWVQMKLTKSSDYLDIIADYLASDVKMEENTSFTINKEKHEKVKSSANRTKKIEGLTRSPNPNEAKVAKGKLGTQLPPIVKEETSLVDKILSEMLGDKPGIDIKKTKSLDKIAKKHKVSVEYLEKQLKKGIKIEMEHTTDKGEAEIIALHHLEEIPDYYTHLNKMEKSVEMEEAKKYMTKDEDPCWKGYEMVGFKKKRGKKVPNCVPVSEATTRLPMQTGQLLRVLVNWRGKHLSVQMFFPQLGTPKRNEIDYAVNQIYPEARVISYVPCEMDSSTPIVQVKEDWQKVNKKDRVDGMSQKAVNTYRRENPGSKLQTAVTEKNPTGKRMQRRTNYCTRSKGQQEMHNISCSKTPDKPICKARRRWNCKN
jgi:hypothetical protein